MSDRFRLVPEVHLFLLDGHSRVLLLRRCNTGFEDGSYSVVAGHVEADEAITFAAIREAKEEGAIGILRDDLHVAGIMHRNYQAGIFHDEFGWHEPAQRRQRRAHGKA